MINKDKLLHHSRSLRGRWFSVSAVDAECVNHAAKMRVVEKFLTGNNLTDDGLHLAAMLIQESEDEFQGDTQPYGRMHNGG